MKGMRVFAACALAAALASCGGPGTKPSPPGGGGQPPPVNTPPQIRSLTAAAPRVEVGAPVTVTAVVEDLETPVADLTYTWTSSTGTFTGTGPVVTWTAAQDAKTPEDYTLTLTVIERVTNGSITVENTATETATVRVNNSPKELAELALRFLDDFADSRVSPEECVAEFSESGPCGRGKNSELSDIEDNRHDFLILDSRLRTRKVDVAPGGLTATVQTSCSFTSRVITTAPRAESCQVPGACPLGSVGTVEGDCRTTHVYEKGRWWLCESSFTASSTLTAFGRAFLGIGGPE
jgi:hypothetical protein